MRQTQQDISAACKKDMDQKVANIKNQNPSLRQVKLFRWICLQLKINYNEALQMQSRMDMNEMSKYIEDNIDKAKLLSLPFDKLVSGIRKVRKATRIDSKKLLKEKPSIPFLDDDDNDPIKHSKPKDD